MATVHPKRRIRWYHKAVLSAICAGVFLGCCELVCRAMKLAPPKDPPFKFIARDFDNDVEYPFMVEDADMLWAPRPGFQCRDCYYGADVQINSAGFRDREYPASKDRGVFRILCLGDSTTFGHGVPIEETYHSLLEEMLNLVDGQSGSRYEVINGGVPGYSSAQCLAMYEHRGRQLRPDTVLLNVGANDPVVHGPLDDDQLLSMVRPNMLRTIDESLSNLHSYRTMDRLMSRFTASQDADAGRPVMRVAPEAFRRNVVRLDELCRTDGCRLILIAFPYCCEIARERFAESQIGGEFAPYEALMRSYHQSLATVARQRGIPLLNVPMLTTTANRRLFFDSFHPNQGGHMVLALALEQFLRDYGLLPASGPPPDPTLRTEAIHKLLDAKGLLRPAEESAPRSPEESPQPRGQRE